MVRLPVHISDRVGLMRKATRKLRAELNREPSLEEIAKEMGLSVKKVRQLLGFGTEVSRLDAPIGEDEDSLLEGIVKDPDGSKARQLMENSVLREALMNKIDEVLYPREREIILLRYGFVDDCPHTLEQLALMYGITRERVRQIERNAIKRLTQPSVIREFADYFYE